MISKQKNQLKNIKILWIASWYPSRVFPQIGGFVRRQAVAVATQSVEVCVVHATEDAMVLDYEITTTKSPNLLEINIFYKKSNFKLLKIIRLIWALYKGWQQAQRDFGQPDLVHLHVLYPSGILVWWLHLWHRLPFVVTEHRGGYIHSTGSYRGLFMKIFTKLTIERAAAVLALSNYFAEAMQKHGLRNPHYYVVPNVVDVQKFKISDNKQAISEKVTPQYKSDFLEDLSQKNLVNLQPATDNFRFVHVSMMADYIKNITGILRATAKLTEKRSDFTLEIIGDGDDRNVILQTAADLNLGERVIFRGVLSHSEVAEQMSASDAFVLFSNIEALPCVILEAMSCGLPTIATETGGISEWITAKTGVLLSIGDEIGLTEAMDFLMDDKEKFDPSVIRQKIIEQCSVESVRQKIVDVYLTVLTKAV